jgi:hypothetical protein
MAKAAKKVATTLSPRIHPELVATINKPTLKDKPPRRKSKRVKLLSARSVDSVIDQTRVAFSVSAIGSMVGLILGSSVPLTTFAIAHYEWKEILSVYSFIVVGGLVFSAKNVFVWGKGAFRDSWKAAGFVILMELTMIFSQIKWVSFMGLGILIAINAIASGANLVIKPQKKPSWEV